MIFEGNQPRVVTIRATHVELIESIVLSFLDRFPHQKLCPTQIAESVV